MKKNFTIYLLMICLSAISIKSFATLHTITVGNGQFSPNSVSAVTGDTIRWVWLNGSHTTTCDGSSPTVLPAGATPWDSPISSANPMFDYVLTAAGNYTYKCTPHGFTGMLNVSQGTGIISLTPHFNHLDIAMTTGLNASIAFYIPVDGKVNLSIYDLTGKKVQTILDAELSKGEYTKIWETVSAQEGTYLCRLESKEFTSTRKFILSR